MKCDFSAFPKKKKKNLKFKSFFLLNQESVGLCSLDYAKGI